MCKSFPVYYPLFPLLALWGQHLYHVTNLLIIIDMSWPGEKVTWPGSAALSMIGECRWVLQCFPYRHWISSPPLKAVATASPGTSCTEPQFSRQASDCLSSWEGGQDEVNISLFQCFDELYSNLALADVMPAKISRLNVGNFRVIWLDRPDRIAY